MKLQIILNKKNNLTQPIVIIADNDNIEMLAQDIDALEEEYPEVFALDDLFEQLDAFQSAGYEITDCHASNESREE